MNLTELVRLEVSGGRSMMIRELARMRREERSAYDATLAESVHMLATDEDALDEAADLWDRVKPVKRYATRKGTK